MFVCWDLWGGRCVEWTANVVLVLKFLHTDPKHQKRGAGGMLVKWGVDKAKEMGLPAYLEASTAGKPLYEKHGFETIGECIFDLGKWGGEGTSGVALMLHPGGQR